MKLSFIGRFLYNAGATDGGGFTTEEKKELKACMEDVKKHYEGKIGDEVGGLKEAMNENQKAIDLLLTRVKEGGLNLSTKPTFTQAFSDQVKTQYEAQKDAFEAFAKGDRHARVAFELKTVGDMGTGNLTGNGVGTYSPGQVLAPGQRVNMRSLIPTVQSPTGTYISYKETGSEGNFGKQTEGAGKNQIDYDFAEIKTVSNYIAGFARFNKQLMRHLPFLQDTLPRLLLRDFYKAENAYFWDVFATQANGFNTTSETKDPLELIDILMGRADQDYDNSFILCSHTEVGRILKQLYEDQNYLGAGAIVGTQNGVVSIAGVPVIGASFAKSKDKALIVDNTFVERVEVEGIRVEFSYEDADNFTKNKVTVRVECMEELAILKTEAHTYHDMGNSSFS